MGKVYVKVPSPEKLNQLQEIEDRTNDLAALFEAILGKDVAEGLNGDIRSECYFEATKSLELAKAWIMRAVLCGDTSPPALEPKMVLAFTSVSGDKRYLVIDNHGRKIAGLLTESEAQDMLIRLKMEMEE